MSYVIDDTISICVTREEALFLASLLEKADNQNLKNIRRKLLIGLTEKANC